MSGLRVVGPHFRVVVPAPRHEIKQVQSSANSDACEIGKVPASAFVTFIYMTHQPDK